jgi:glutaminase
MDLAEIISEESVFIERILGGQLVVPKWSEFTADISRIFHEIKSVEGGKVADYIPQLGKVDPSYFAVSVCTIDGQRFSIGDFEVDFCVQSCCKPIAYGMALEEHGVETVLKHIGIEPSGQRFNKLTLNDKGLPHNPMLNAGAIISHSLIKTKSPMDERFEHIMSVWNRLTGNGRVGFHNSVYLSERASANRNFCLAYMMQESGAFPKDARLMDSLELYFQGCSITVNCQDFAVLAATLANGGTCPVTNDAVFDPATVRNILSLMFSCGMYDFSGEWAFSVGIPAKSGVGGSIYGVIPGFGGFCVWSPPLDEIGNSFKGVQFFKRLVSEFRFHHFDVLALGGKNEDLKKDPRKTSIVSGHAEIFEFLQSVAEGNFEDVSRRIIRGANLDCSDYDRRTPLHLAASEGHIEIVSLLLRNGVKVNPIDRWGSSPLDDAIRGNYRDTAEMLQSHGAISGRSQD